MLQLVGRQALDASERADGHEDGCIDRAVRSGDTAEACRAILMEKLESQSRYHSGLSTQALRTQDFYCSFICSTRTVGGRLSTNLSCATGSLIFTFVNS